MAGVIVTNAAFLQTKRHPAPLFASFPEEGGQAASAAQASPPNLPVGAGVAAKAPVKPIQEGLARAGFYDGPLDGVAGPRTVAAIVAFEKSAKLVPTGQPTEALLGRLRQVASPVPVPRPKVVGRSASPSDVAEQ